MLAGGRTVSQVLQHLGVSKAIFSLWRSQYGGVKSEAAEATCDRTCWAEVTVRGHGLSYTASPQAERIGASWVPSASTNYIACRIRASRVSAA